MLIKNLGNCLSAIWEGAFKLTFASLIIAAVLGATFFTSRDNFPATELGRVLALGMVVSGALLVGAQAIALRSKFVANVSLAVVTVGSVFTAYLVHTELYFPENRILLAAIISLASFALFVAFRIIDEHRWGGVALSATVLVWASWPVWPDAVSGLSLPGGVLALNSPRFWAVLTGAFLGGLLVLLLMYRHVHESHWGGGVLLTLILAGVAVVVWTHLDSEIDLKKESWDKHPDVRAITFEETPNVYFVGFDSIVPDSILRKYIDIETTEFHGVINNDMRRFRNLFSNGASTRNSFNALMALSQDIFVDEMQKHTFQIGPRPRYFSGEDQSPLLWIMRENGYETTSIYDDTYFGRAKGPYVDNYFVNRKYGSICALLDEEVGKWAFWGYCRVIGITQSQDVSVSKGEFVLQKLTNVSDRVPQFVIAHLYMPGHTSREFNYEDKGDRDRFAVHYRNAADEAAAYLVEIIEHLKINDPNAILFVFGDHGIHLSRQFELEEDPTFVLQDRFGILGGIYPHDRCEEYINKAERKGYLTTLDSVHAILNCLSGGQSALSKPRNDQFWWPGIARDKKYDYKEFLYE